MNALFSEVYGCYFDVVSRVLNRAQVGLTRQRLAEEIENNGFSETAFHLLPALIGDDWGLTEQRGELYVARLRAVKRPLTKLELSWLASLLQDRRLRLFLTQEKIEALRSALEGVKPLFYPDDLKAVDAHADGDPYEDCGYIQNFRTLTCACKDGRPVSIAYYGRAGQFTKIYHPYKLSYSQLNDKFRLLCAVVNRGRPQKVILNLARIRAVDFADDAARLPRQELEALFLRPDEETLTVEIGSERNAPARFLLQFASFDRRTEYDAERGVYLCRLSYDRIDETELLIRVLSFGPAIKVLGPDHFVEQIKERLKKQLSLWPPKNSL